MYCSAECQEADRETHLLLCEPLSWFQTRPEEDRRRAIFFPVDASCPSFVWVRYGWVEDHGCDDVDYDFLLRDRKPQQLIRPVDTCRKRFEKNEVQGRELRTPIELVWRRDLLKDGLQNKSITEATNNLMGADWKGPVVAFGTPRHDPDSPHCEDLQMTDFRDIVDNIAAYGNGDKTDQVKHRGGKDMGVKVAVIGEETLLCEVLVPRRHPVFALPSTSDVPRLLGFPLLMRRCRPHPVWRDAESTTPNSPNLAAKILNIVADAGSLEWGSIATSWQGVGGSVLVVRQDEKPLQALDLQILCDFCRYVVAPLLKQSLQVRNIREAILRTITEARFNKYYDEYSLYTVPSAGYYHIL